MEWMGGHCCRSSNSGIRASRANFEGALQQEGPNSSRWVPFILNPKIELPEC